MLQVNSSVNGRYYISDIVVTVEDGHSTKTYTVSIQLLSSSDTCLMLGHNHSNTKVFLQVLQGVLSDESFKIGTPDVTQALESADLVFKCRSRSENREIVSTFTTILINDLSSALE